MSSTSKYVNQEALDSQIYNPTMDPKVLMLQQLMETTAFTPVAPRTTAPLLDPETVPPELKEHVETFNALSTQNPFQGVIVTPASCLIDDVRGDLIECGIVGSELDDTSGQSDWTDYEEEFDADCEEINEQCDQIQDHTDRLTSNLPSLAGIAQGALALATVMSLLSNPCLGLDGLLGSIMDSGKQLLNSATSAIKSALNSVKNKLAQLKDAISSGINSAIASIKASIGPMIDNIKGAIASANAAVSNFIDKAKTEIMNFAKALLANVRQGLAELLANLPKDPCLRGLLTSAATGAAAAIIK